MQQVNKGKETSFVLKTGLLIQRSIGSIVFLSLVVWIWLSWPSGNETSLNLIFSVFDLNSIRGLTDAGRNVFLYGYAIIKIIIALLFLSSFRKLIRSMACYSVAITKDQFIFSGLWQTRIHTAKDFKTFSHIDGHVDFLLNNGIHFRIHTNDFDNADQLMQHIEFAIPELREKELQDEKEWVRGFPLSKLDIKLVEQRYGISNEEAKSLLTEAAKWQLVLLPVSAMSLIPVLIPLFPILLFFILRKEKLLVSLLPRRGYYSLIGPILINAFLAGTSNNSYVLFTSPFSWLITISLALFTTYCLFKAEKSHADEVKQNRLFSPGSMVIIAALIFLFYFLTEIINCRLDFSQPEEWQVVVTEKYYFTRGESDYPVFVITTTGNNIMNSVELNVGEETYQTLNIGDSATQSIGHGLFGSWWATRDPQLVTQ